MRFTSNSRSIVDKVLTPTSKFLVMLFDGLFALSSHCHSWSSLQNVIPLVAAEMVKFKADVNRYLMDISCKTKDLISRIEIRLFYKFSC